MKEQLIEALKTIGWTYRRCGCDIYQIVSHHKKGTDILFNDQGIWVESTSIFGKDARKDRYHTMGNIKFIFKNCELKIEEGFVSISTNGAFMMFRGNKKTN